MTPAVWKDGDKPTKVSFEVLPTAMTGNKTLSDLALYFLYSDEAYTAMCVSEYNNKQTLGTGNANVVLVVDDDVDTNNKTTTENHTAINETGFTLKLQTGDATWRTGSSYGHWLQYAKIPVSDGYLRITAKYDWSKWDSDGIVTIVYTVSDADGVYSEDRTQTTYSWTYEYTYFGDERTKPETFTVGFSALTASIGYVDNVCIETLNMKDSIGWVGTSVPEGLKDDLGSDYLVNTYSEGENYDIIVISGETTADSVQAYLDVESKPFVLMTTDAETQNMAEDNMSIASEKALPCLDIYAYTNSGGTDVSGTYASAIKSLEKDYTGGYEFNESELNSFLTPELYSATIKNTATPAEQGLGFKTIIQEYQKTGTTIEAYGTIFARYNKSQNYDDMVLGNVGNGKYFNANITVTDDSEVYGNSYIAGINLHNNQEFTKVYIARSYVKYADGSVYYSINTRTDLNSSLTSRVGVLDGYACRALTGVAKNMVIALAEQGIDISKVGTYDSSTGTLTYGEGVINNDDDDTTNDAKPIFELLFANQSILESIQNTVYLASSGSDDNNGTKSTPYLTLGKALASVPDGGTIVVADTVSVTDFDWEEQDKNVTITGGTLNFTDLSDVTLGDDVTFQTTNLTFPTATGYNDAFNLFANGHSLVIDEDVTMTNAINVYGGSNGSNVDSTDVTLKAGIYYRVYGGGNGGSVKNNTSLYIAGKVNNVDGASAHATTYQIYAGGNNDTIGGNTKVIFEGDAQTCKLFGGSAGDEATIAGTSDITFNSGTVYAIFGGNDTSSQIKGTKVVVNGGTIAQIFGANQNASMEGNVDLQVLGGTITRRVYGGCYNGYGTTSFSTDYYVTGNINLTLGYDVTFNLTDTDNEGDLSVYARSRHNQVSANENSTIYWTSEAKEKHESTLGAQDEKMKAIMKTVLVLGTDITAADKFVVLNASE